MLGRAYLLASIYFFNFFFILIPTNFVLAKNPSYAIPMSEVEKENFLNTISTEIANRRGIDVSIVKQFMRASENAFMLPEENKLCPFKFKIFNFSEQALWNIEVKVEQELSSSSSRNLDSNLTIPIPQSNKIETIHIPFLPKNSQVNVMFTCIRNTNFYGQGSDNTVIAKFSDRLPADYLNAKTVRTMIDTNVDYMISGNVLSPKTSTNSGKKSMALAVLPQISNQKQLREFIRLMLKFEDGVSLFSKYVLTQPKVLSSDVIELIAKDIPEKSTEKFLENGLLSQNPDLFYDLAEEILAARCTKTTAKSKKYAHKMWLWAVEDKIKGERIRRLVMQTCQASLEKIKTFLTVESSSIESKVDVLDALKKEKFSRTINLLYRSSEGKKTLLYFTEKTKNQSKFDEVYKLFLNSNGISEIEEFFNQALLKKNKIFTPEKVIESAKQGDLDLIDFVRSYSDNFGNCFSSIDQLDHCTTSLKHKYSNLIPQGFHVEFLNEVEELITDSRTNPLAVSLSRQYQQWGMDTTKVTEQLCQDAINEIQNNNFEKSQDLVDRVLQIDSEADCNSRVSLKTFWQKLSNILKYCALIGFEILVLTGPLALLIYKSRLKWKKIRPLIYNQDKIASDVKLLSPDKWKKRFNASFYQSIKKLEKIAEGQTVSKTLTKLTENSLEVLAKKTYSLAVTVVEEGRLQSLLIDVDGIIVYALIFPGMHDQPSMLKRYYKPFNRGWVFHLHEVHKILLVDKPDVVMVNLIIFLSPDIKKGTMHLTFLDNNVQILPTPLLNSLETKNSEGTSYDSRMIF